MGFKPITSVHEACALPLCDNRCPLCSSYHGLAENFKRRMFSFRLNILRTFDLHRSRALGQPPDHCLPRKRFRPQPPAPKWPRRTGSSFTTRSIRRASSRSTPVSSTSRQRISWTSGRSAAELLELSTKCFFKKQIKVANALFHYITLPELAPWDFSSQASLSSYD